MVRGTPFLAVSPVMRLKLSVRCTVDRLGNTLAVGVVAIGDAAAALAHGRQLTAMLPGVGPRAVGQGIAYGVVGDGLPVERRQQVRPIGVAVGVGAAYCPDVAVNRRPRPSTKTIIPPRRVPDPPGQEVFPRAAGFQSYSITSHDIKPFAYLFFINGAWAGILNLHFHKVTVQNCHVRLPTTLYQILV